MNDETQRGGTEVGEGITSYQRQFRTVRAIENCDILGSKHLRGVDFKLVKPAFRYEFDMVPQSDVAQRPEYSIAMRGNAQVSALSRQASTRNVTGPKAQRSRVISFNHHRGYVESRDFKPPDDFVRMQDSAGKWHRFA